MPWIDSRTPLISTLRRLKSRFLGASAPKVMVRAQMPWYARALFLALVLVLFATLTMYAYDSGRRVAGYEQSESGLTIEELRQANRELSEEVARMRGLLMAADSNLRIEQSSQRLLNEKNIALAEQNARLKEDLAVYERLLKPNNIENKTIALDRFKVSADGSPGGYRYSFQISLQGARRGKETKLKAQLAITPDGAAPSANIILPRPGDADISNYDIELRNFRRIEGRFQLPAGVTFRNIELRIFEAGEIIARLGLTL